MINLFFSLSPTFVHVTPVTLATVSAAINGPTEHEIKFNSSRDYDFCETNCKGHNFPLSGSPSQEYLCSEPFEMPHTHPFGLS